MSPAFCVGRFDDAQLVFENEATPFIDEVLTRLKQSSALAPALWPFEIANVLSAAERKGRLQSTQQAEFL